MRNTVSQSELMAPERSLTVALKSSSATHTNWYLSLIAAIPPKLVRWLRLSEQNFRVDKWSLCRG
jgi:hypothetical protein